jgi:hypothetical protein
LSKQCGGFKRDGSQCTATVNPPQTYCWWHDPANAEQRKRAASRAGRGKSNKEVQGIKARLEDLADGVLLGTIDRSDAEVVGQIWNTYLRAVSVELKVKEVLDLEARLEELETLLEERRDVGGRRGG